MFRAGHLLRHLHHLLRSHLATGFQSNEVDAGRGRMTSRVPTSPDPRLTARLDRSIEYGGHELPHHVVDLAIISKRPAAAM